MMNLFMAAAIVLLTNSNQLSAAVSVGKEAPDFSLPSSKGASVKLSDRRGKIVVLEWTNKDCPFVKKHYDSKNMQNLQKEFTDKGVLWYSIISSAPGKQGHLSSGAVEDYRKEAGVHSTSTLIDETGKVGKIYGAKTTPHIFIVDAKGTLAYQGAIDSKRSSNPEDIASAKNFVRQALGQLVDGKIVTESVTDPYGCSVKY